MPRNRIDGSPFISGNPGEDGIAIVPEHQLQNKIERYYVREALDLPKGDISGHRISAGLFCLTMTDSIYILPTKKKNGDSCFRTGINTDIP